MDNTPQYYPLSIFNYPLNKELLSELIAMQEAFRLRLGCPFVF